MDLILKILGTKTDYFRNNFSDCTL